MYKVKGVAHSDKPTDNFHKHCSYPQLFSLSQLIVLILPPTTQLSSTWFPALHQIADQIARMNLKHAFIKFTQTCFQMNVNVVLCVQDVQKASVC